MSADQHMSALMSLCTTRSNTMYSRIVIAFLENNLGHLATSADHGRYTSIIQDILSAEDAVFLSSLSDEDLGTVVGGDQDEEFRILASGPDGLSERLDECYVLIWM